MSLDTILSENITFSNPASPLVTIPVSALQDLLGAVQDLKEEVAALREERDQDREEMAAMRLKLASLETRQDEDISRLALDIAYDRQRLAKLEKGQCSPPTTPPPGSKTASRIEKVKDFLKTRGGGATFQECERLLGIRPNQMSRLVSMLDMRSWEIFARSGDLRQKVLRLKAGRLFT